MATHRMLCTKAETRQDPVALAQQELGGSFFGQASPWKRRRITGARFDGEVLVVEYESVAEARPKLARRRKST